MSSPFQHYGKPQSFKSLDSPTAMSDSAARTPGGSQGLVRKFFNYVSGSPNLNAASHALDDPESNFMESEQFYGYSAGSPFDSPSHKPRVSSLAISEAVPMNASPMFAGSSMPSLSNALAPAANSSHSPIINGAHALKGQHHRLSYASPSPKYQIANVAIERSHAESSVINSHQNAVESMMQAQKSPLKPDPSILNNGVAFDDEITINLHHRNMPKPWNTERGSSENFGAPLKPSPSLPELSTQLVSMSLSPNANSVDPVIPENWMMFDTPGKNANNLGQHSAVEQQPSLLDDIPISYVSPDSRAKYSERQMTALKVETLQIAQKESAQLKLQVRELEARVSEAENSRMQMKSVVDQYEQAMNKMIDESKQEKERNRIQIEKTLEEKARCQNDLTTVENSFQELRQRYEDIKGVNEQYRKNESALKLTIDDLKRDIQASEQRVDAVKQHAEKKLSEASDEIEKVQHQSEKDIALLKAKLQKGELKMKSLEQTIEQKKTENAELMAICDDLIKKMEGVDSNGTS